ncbi:MAG: hypothetical protein CME70_06815 [Halobacteriovorax sp.]|nr:hypothetical protein [Halobacteriovorax sp.]|tara:strand:+ start:489954 stop:490193 length:240 start_codon:yes stop_codon:yes gene_type:complete
MRVILISKILKTGAGQHSYVAHFKGFVFGKRVNEVVLTSSIYKLEISETYLLLLKDVKIECAILRGTVERQKALTEVLN